jgi:ATP-binding cassette, subfamily B (MDR/TAP), member 10
MASTVALRPFPTPNPTRPRTLKPRLSLSSRPPPLQSHPFPPLPRKITTTPRKNRSAISFAYVSGPASDPNVSEADPRVYGSDSRAEKIRPPNAISWGLLWSLLAEHKLRLAVSALTLVGCTTCTLSMPIFSGTENEGFRFQT